MNCLIKVHNLNYTIPYGAHILSDLNFTLNAGEFVGVLGKNGSGKTTLMDLLLGFRPLTSGTIEILGESPIDFRRKNMQSICFLSHEANSRGNISIGQYLALFADLYPAYSKEEEKYLIDFFSLKVDDKIGSLSTGQQKKVQAVAAFSALPKLILIDEMTAVLDPETRDQFFRVIEYMKKKRNMSFLMATNIAEDLIGRADRILFIEQGKASIKESSEILHLFKIEKAS